MMDIRAKEIIENYNKSIAIDKDYRENILSADQGKKVYIYDGQNHTKPSAFRTAFGQTKMSDALGSTIRRTRSLMMLVLHLLVVLLFWAAMYIIIVAFVLPMVPVGFHTPIIVAAVIFTIIASVRA